MKGGLIVPKSTFFNLPEEKRDAIISSALEEFSSANYNLASINQICKRANIAKGSFYQYFRDKLDLYVYIMTIAINTKIEFFNTALERFQTLSLFEQIRLLFKKGLEFTKTYPMYAALGEQFSKENDNIAKSAVLKEGEKKSSLFFVHMIDKAKSKGEIQDNVDTLALSMLLQSLNQTVIDYMMDKYNEINYEQYEEEVNQLVNSLLNIIFKGISNKDNFYR
nr:TetR/AcrR family transcriptional regulator [Tissierella simiarum]